MYTPGTIANSWTGRTTTKISKNGGDTIRHLKNLRVISNEMLVLRLILC